VKSSSRRVNEGGCVITCQHSTRDSRRVRPARGYARSSGAPQDTEVRACEA
jgi:hypothetical protein